MFVYLMVQGIKDSIESKNERESEEEEEDEDVESGFAWTNIKMIEVAQPNQLSTSTSSQSCPLNLELTMSMPSH